MPAGFPKGQTAFTTAKVIVARAFPPPSTSWRHAAKPFDPEQLRATPRTSPGSRPATPDADAAVGRPALGRRSARLHRQLQGARPCRRPEVGLDGNAPEIAAGIEAAVRDGMDVINLSLGEPEIEPARDIVVAAVEGATRAGVVVTTAAVVLGSEPGQSSASEVGEIVDCRIRLGKNGFKLADLCFEAFDLSDSRVRGFSGLLQLLKPVLEFGAQVCVGPGAVEGGPVAPGLECERLDIAVGTSI